MLAIHYVLSAVQFDNQFMLNTNEINNIAANGVLPPEFEPNKMTVSQVVPQLFLCIRLTLAKVFCQARIREIAGMLTLTPTLSLEGRGGGLLFPHPSLRSKSMRGSTST